MMSGVDMNAGSGQFVIDTFVRKACKYLIARLASQNRVRDILVCGRINRMRNCLWTHRTKEMFYLFMSSAERDRKYNMQRQAMYPQTYCCSILHVRTFFSVFSEIHSAGRTLQTRDQKVSSAIKSEDRGVHGPRPDPSQSQDECVSQGTFCGVSS